jgi:hypothetical protein
MFGSAEGSAYGRASLAEESQTELNDKNYATSWNFSVSNQVGEGMRNYLLAWN